MHSLNPGKRAGPCYNGSMETIAHARSLVGQWSNQHNHAVLFDDESSLLVDVASGKRVKLSWEDVKAFEEKIHPETGDYYLVLLF